MLFLPIQKFTEAAKRCETSASTFSTRLRIVSFKTPAFKKQHMALHRELQVEGVKAKSYCARHPSKTASCHCHNEGSGAQTKACATLGLCDLRGTLRQCDHLRPYSKTIFGATAPRVGLRGPRANLQRTTKSWNWIHWIIHPGHPAAVHLGAQRRQVQGILLGNQQIRKRKLLETRENEKTRLKLAKVGKSWDWNQCSRILRKYRSCS